MKKEESTDEDNIKNIKKILLKENMLKSHKQFIYFIKHCFVNTFSTDLRKRFLNMNSYIWIDMEMTGLDPAVHTVLEIACIITTPQLQSVHEGIHLIIHQPPEILNSMNDWSLKHHSESGLTELCKKSKLTLHEADKQVAKYITNHAQGSRYLAGNSIYMDKMFLMKYFPKTNNLLHYRIIDVSSIKILCSDWYPDKFESLSKKKLTHRALDDIKESIQELQNYRQIFKSF